MYQNVLWNAISSVYEILLFQFLMCGKKLYFSTGYGIRQVHFFWLTTRNKVLVLKVLFSSFVQFLFDLSSIITCVKINKFANSKISSNLIILCGITLEKIEWKLYNFCYIRGTVQLVILSFISSNSNFFSLQIFSKYIRNSS